MFHTSWGQSKIIPIIRVGIGLGQFSLFGRVASIIKHPFGVTGAYMAGTSLVACMWHTTHQEGMTIFFEVRFCKQILTIGARFKVTIHTGGNYLIREALFPGFSNYMHSLNVTCNPTDIRYGLQFQKGTE